MTNLRDRILAIICMTAVATRDAHAQQPAPFSIPDAKDLQCSGSIVPPAQRDSVGYYMYTWDLGARYVMTAYDSTGTPRQIDEGRTYAHSATPKRPGEMRTVVLNQRELVGWMAFLPDRKDSSAKASFMPQPMMRRDAEQAFVLAKWLWAHRCRVKP